ncbi:mRNA-degrading endonuclease RelE of RelBE toxin-antitoxin system [Parabacteroides sp. PF5-5]|nr:mRNA-degrading endonuclease RelE of RelBE toxin-antitoxin system [Parabacteroides sp. PH5-39]MDH6315780.1 mRNA-degrading endonuclease RelE of RelBE toxin-antitoxin system [Parabacteroides sp. PF5-13]MDH6319439.1 mRNA-degrading endonuclease RelE of RelBE toxin-antitoxin system [Parabacteroides sp. PH5-13]MDH6323170.1 mRNA-degrading endonuclease RelE of RelBE toxin-antitoxin system [Parabacteroides sp. PH5-8]MDH6326972.1 mRNA-degrading endonuclease RelE of RelBE toxin-antitoxin system [Parabac
MCTYLSTESFRTQISKLTKKAKDGYSSINEDVCSVFSSLKHEDIVQLSTTIWEEETFKIKKIRIGNSHLKLSKRDGFRLFFLVRKDRKEVVFLFAYPKNGCHGQIDIPTKDRLNLLKEYINTAGSLVKHDIANSLAPI